MFLGVIPCQYAGYDNIGIFAFGEFNSCVEGQRSGQMVPVFPMIDLWEEGKFSEGLWDIGPSRPQAYVHSTILEVLSRQDQVNAHVCCSGRSTPKHSNINARKSCTSITCELF